MGTPAFFTWVPVFGMIFLTSKQPVGMGHATAWRIGADDRSDGVMKLKRIFEAVYRRN